MTRNKRYWQFLRNPPSKSIKFRVEIIDDIPEIISRHVVYVLGSQNKYWALAFLCPCDCGAVIQLNLLKRTYPKWEFTINQQMEITIYPSVWRKTGCKSHFIIKDSRLFPEDL